MGQRPGLAQRLIAGRRVVGTGAVLGEGDRFGHGMCLPYEKLNAGVELLTGVRCQC